MATQIQLRRDTEGDWNTADPTLAEGEIGLIVGSSGEITGLKVGDGTTRWEALKLAVPMLSGVANILEESDSSANEPVGGTDGAGDKTTFLLKGLSGQSAAVFGIEATGSTTLVLSIDKLGGITAAAGVNVSGGYAGTGLTVSNSGDVTTKGSVFAVDEIQSGTYTTTAGDDSGAQLKDNADHGQLLVSSNSSSTPAADTAIHVNTNAADKFVVKYDGAVTAAGLTTTVGLTTTAGITNSGADITMDGQKITGLGAPSADTTDAATTAYVDAADTTATSARTAGFFLGSIGAIWRSGTASESQQIFDSDLTATLGGTTVTSNGKTWTKSTIRLGYYQDPFFGGTTSTYLYIRTA